MLQSPLSLFLAILIVSTTLFATPNSSKAFVVATYHIATLVLGSILGHTNPKAPPIK
jgi:hypothetical protein